MNPAPSARHARLEVLSPHDRALEKFEHYARFGVVEIFIVDPDAETVQIFVRPSADDDNDFVSAESSPLLDVAADELAARLDW